MTTADRNLSISRTTKDGVPPLPFSSLKADALGKHYDLSIVFIGDKRARSLNRTYRKKDYVPNVLSFPLDDAHGEIFVDLRQAKREHRARGESFEYFVALLVVHGMLHLKGMMHGGRMEELEARILARNGIENGFSIG